MLFLLFSFGFLWEDEVRVDLDRYLGTWIENASIEQRFSRGCTFTRANYSKDGKKIKVINECIDETSGKKRIAKGRAKSTNETNSKLKVSFFWPFYGQYWIVGLDEDYRIAIVSNEDKTSLWILSRELLDETTYNSLLVELRERGYPVEKLKITKQN